MKRLGLALAIILVLMAACVGPESFTVPTYDMSICKPGSMEVISDCAAANEVACECVTLDNFHVRVAGPIEGRMACVATCVPYGGQ